MREPNRIENRNIHATTLILPELDFNPEGEILLFDKPYRCTSFDVVAKVKSAIRKKFNKKIKVGHAGTLDPLATGLVILCTGKMTKQINMLMDLEKEYTGTFFLGATTSSFDMEKEVNATFPTEYITEQQIYAIADSFLGESDQVPPIYSAVRIDGKRAYDMARRGQEAKIQPRKIQIDRFEITRIALPEVDFRIVCSKGTYIRSIARDFGERLDSGAHLTALRRTAIGNYRVENAHSLS